MDLKQVIVGLLFIVGGYMLLDIIANVIRNDVEQDIKEKVLKDVIVNHKQNNGKYLDCNTVVPPNPDRVISRDLESGCVYTPSNVKLWEEVENVDNTSACSSTCKQPMLNIREKIRDTQEHGDRQLDAYRNDLINTYFEENKLDMDKIDPYDPEVYASYIEQKKACVKQDKPILKLDKPLTGHRFISDNVCANPAPVRYPVLSDTHYLPKDVEKCTFVAGGTHCGLEPSMNKIVSSNLISDKMLNERVGSFKSMVTDSISSELLDHNRIQYKTSELASQYNPYDKNLYEVDSRKPVKSTEYHPTGSVCGYDGKLSQYAEIENNDLCETTTI